MKLLVQLAVIIFIGYYAFDYYLESKFDSSFDIKSLTRVDSKKPGSIDFYIRALGRVDGTDLTDAVKYVEDFYGYKCKIAPAVAITPQMTKDNNNDIISGRETIDELHKYRKTIFIVDKMLWH
jgi:hypothetical protein